MKSKNRLVPLPDSPTSFPHHLVAERAYAIWIARGQPVGCDFNNWADAERELLALKSEQAQEEDESITQLNSWNDPLGSDIERALDSFSPSSQRRSATSL